MIKILIIPADLMLPVRVSEFDEKELKNYQEIVGGYIEVVRIYLPESGSMYVNEEGLLLNLPVNPRASIMYGSHILGDVLITGPADSQGNDTSIPFSFEMLAT